MDSTDPVRAVNADFASFVLNHGGGWIPPAGSGLFNCKILAALAGKTPKWVQDQVRLHRIPYRASGEAGEMFIDPGDLAKFVPFFNDPKKRK